MAIATAPTTSIKLEAPEWSIVVEAHRKGTYPQPNQLNAWFRHPGDRFVIKNMKSFSPEWMTIPGDAVQASNGVEGHGPLPIVPEGTPMTTIRNEVKNPLQVLNDLARVNQAEQRGR